MNLAGIKEALEKARLIVASHGMVNYMPQYARSLLTSYILDYQDSMSFEFFLDPQKTGYSSDNFTCTLNVRYSYDKDVERDGGVYRDYRSRVSLRISSCDLNMEALAKREQMVESLKMLVEMIESVVPKVIVGTVMTPEDLREKRQLAHEQKVAEQIFSVLGKDCIRNARTNGKPKTTVIPESFVNVYGMMPAPGRYRYDHVKYRTRSGNITDRAKYIFSVSKTYNESYVLRAFKTG